MKEKVDQLRADVDIIFVNLNKLKGMANASYAFMKDPRVVEMFPPRKQETDVDAVRSMLKKDAGLARDQQATFEYRAEERARKEAEA